MVRTLIQINPADIKLLKSFDFIVKVREQGIVEINEVDVPEVESILGYSCW